MQDQRNINALPEMLNDFTGLLKRNERLHYDLDCVMPTTDMQLYMLACYLHARTDKS